MNKKAEICFEGNGYPISQNLYGIFYEDINFSGDGGLNANMVNNYSFDGVYFDNQQMKAVEDSLRFWEFDGGKAEVCKEDGLSSNSKYARLYVNGRMVLYNKGYNGQKRNAGKCAMSIKNSEQYEFSCWVRSRGFDGTLEVQVQDEAGNNLTDSVKISEFQQSWNLIKASLSGLKNGYGKLKLEYNGNGVLDVDCISLMNTEYWGCKDAKWKHGKLRKDIVEALKELKPAFMRFPGGCIVEGMLPGNEYNWKDTVGKLYERKSNYSLWSERLETGDYNQSYQIGFYEYFCLCEDLKMKPLPTLSAGLNCQWRSHKRGEKECPNIPVDSEKFQSEVIANYLDLIEFANGDPKEGQWAALRADMGHPEPFGLDRIGIGNENYGEIYFERFKLIQNAVTEKYPEMKCVMCAGLHPFWEETMGFDSLEVVWKEAEKYQESIFVDEHAYHSPEWFISQADRFDSYKRGRAKVYFGEYAANGLLADAMRPMDKSNQLDTAVAEAAFLTGVERNGDLVEMTSYAPLLNLVECDQWNHNLINFNPQTVCLSTNYFVQKLFASNVGKEYIPFKGELPDGVFASATADSGVIYIKLVNTTEKVQELDMEMQEQVECLSAESLCHQDKTVRNELSFEGNAVYKVIPETWEISIQDRKVKCVLNSNSVNVIKLRRMK